MQILESSAAFSMSKFGLIKKLRMKRLLNYLINSSGNRVWNNIFRVMWYGAIGGIALICLLLLFISFTDLPSVQQLENPRSEEASLVLANDGTVLGKFYTENRVPVTFADLSPHLVRALIATEDMRYYNHCGIDFQALGRVAVKTVILQQKSSGGASTITQQLAKLLFTGQKADNTIKRFFQKLKEWIIAVRLERKYTKEEIIAMYLNKFDFINGAYGIKAASEIYFNKSPKDLEIQEAALLIGMLKNPSLFNPLRRPEMALQRRMVVLKQMQKTGVINEQQYNELRALPLGIKFTRQTHVDGLAPYFRMELAKHLKDDILQRKECLKADGTPYDIYRDGLRIYTTIDPDMQRMAEEEMVKHMKKVQESFWRTWKNLDPWTYKTNSVNEITPETRQATLNRHVRESDRYQALRSKYLGDILNRYSGQVDFVFSEDDHELDRIMAEVRKKGTIDQLVKNNIISKNLADRYREVIESDLFPELRTQWETLQESARHVFRSKVEMKVFAYNDKMEKDTVMSPLDSIKYHRMFLQTGIMAVDPATGAIKVWIGGINHKYFQYDHNQIERQVGSTFKPFIYATAIAQQGFSPCYPVPDLPVTIGPGDGQFGLVSNWTPRNAEGNYSGRTLTLKEGLRHSKNTVSVHLMKQLGSTVPVVDLLEQMGITVKPDHRGPAMCLGALDLSVMAMTGAYTTFANNGTFVKPSFITRIEDKTGRLIYEEFPDEKPALGPKFNYVMVEMLRYAGTNLGGIKSDVGGKTGTTNDYVDGWFMGITPGLVVGTWVGGEDKWIRFRSITNGQGAYMAKPFFREFMKRIESDKDLGFDFTKRFQRPPGDLEIELNCAVYLKDQYRPEDSSEEFDTDSFGDEQAPEPPEGEDFN